MESSSYRVPYTDGEVGPGDVACVYADVTLAESLLGWRARRGLDEMCRDHWNWQRQNPNGYA